MRCTLPRSCGASLALSSVPVGANIVAALIVTELGGGSMQMNMPSPGQPRQGLETKSRQSSPTMVRIRILYLVGRRQLQNDAGTAADHLAGTVQSCILTRSRCQSLHRDHGWVDPMKNLTACFGAGSRSDVKAVGCCCRAPAQTARHWGC
ncbi:hypothetical protein CPB85DRAFT_699703 [Mucidula mucida]|nr:hypothetical protein CPB85DRAFT_699703 [Mucidula mucida]